jgi:uncharacterized protein (DUF302 family)
MMTSTHAVVHVRVETAKEFAEVAKDFERQVGKYDPSVLQAYRVAPPWPEDARARIEAMTGPSGFLLFGTTDHGWLVSLFGAKKGRAIQYVVGNPLIATEMTKRNLAAGLYAPLRVLIYEAEGKTRLEYDRPSSVLGQFNDDRIGSVARTLDCKLEDLIAKAVG